LIEYRPIGELLIDMGAITYQDLVKAVSEAARSEKRLGEYLLAEGLIRQEQMAEALSLQQLGEHKSAKPMNVGGPAARYDLDPVLAGDVSAGD
jgi:hypothetical protein